MSEDLIRRSDAIKAINEVGWLEDSEYEERILAVPSVNQEHGEWVFDEKGYFKCSACGHKPYNQNSTTNFCPHCGADMRKEGE